MASQHRAALIPAKGAALEVKDVESSQPGPGQVLVRNRAIVIQPLDAKMLHVGYAGAGELQYPALLGAGGAGIVEAVGSNVVELSVGDRVVFDTKAYADPAANRQQATWQQLVVSEATTVAKIGDTPFEQAVLINLPLQTAVSALVLSLGAGKPSTGKSDEKVLIWGAGGAVGSYAVQYAKSVGYTVVVTASPRDVERQKAMGASEVIDYKAPDAVGRLRELGPYRYLFTASGDPASQKALAMLVQPGGGRFASVLGGDVELPSNVQRLYLPFTMAAQKNAGFRDWWYKEYLPSVLRNKLVEPTSFLNREGGLGALQQASLEVVQGKIRGKVIVDPQD